MTLSEQEVAAIRLILTTMPQDVWSQLSASQLGLVFDKLNPESAGSIATILFAKHCLSLVIGDSHA